MRHINQSLGVALVCVLFAVGNVSAKAEQPWKRLQDLRGGWKFSIGDNSAWADSAFDDSHWDEIFVPANWEEEGFPGYDGYAWYRKKFMVKPTTQTIYLDLGQVDDVDEVYLNGKLVGLSGRFPPNYASAAQINRKYAIPAAYFNPHGQNTLAIRVYDAELKGGIVKGHIGLYEYSAPEGDVVLLDGYWKFHAGDHPKWAEPQFDDAFWQEVYVPSSWDIYGYTAYDGYGWYRMRFTISEAYKDERLVLLLGKIDDFDEAFLNGELIGSTGRMKGNPSYNNYNANEWRQQRVYKLDAGLLNFSGENVLAVRVFDGLHQGGIYEGPVRIVTYDAYRKYHREANSRERRSLLDIFLWR